VSCPDGLPRRPGPAREYIHWTHIVYIGGGRVTKRLIDLDDDLLAEAQRELHTAGVSDTVRAALRQAAAAGARARQLAWLTDGGLAELADPDERAKVWR